MKLPFFIKSYLPAILILMQADCLPASDIYRWVDKEGVTHFSNRPPDTRGIPYEVFQKKPDEEPAQKKQVKTEKQPDLKKDPIEYAADCTFTIKGKEHIGTGFFISPNGYAVTCKHVIEDAPNHRAVLNNQEEYSIGIISKSHKYDLALILVSTVRKNPYLTFRDPFTMKPGEKVYAVGSSAGLQSTVTDGAFSGLRKKMPTEQMTIQFSAPVNPGNSGGPLLDKNGKVVGAVSWKLLSNNGIPVTGIGFAVPSDYILEEYGAYMK